MIHLQLTAPEVIKLRQKAVKIRTPLLDKLNAVMYEMAVTLRNRVYQNLLSDRYGFTYPAYTPGYAKWKQKQVGHLKHWQLWGLVKSNIGIRKIKSGVTRMEIGYEIGIMDETAKGYAYTYVEPRFPLFVPTGKEFLFEVDNFLAKYKESVQYMWRI